MTKMFKNSKGFAVVEGLLLLIIVAILIGTMVYVYKSNKNTTNDLNNVNSSQVNQSPSKVTTKKYVTIKEWGVRMPYSGNIDFTYKIDNSSGVSVAGFSSKQLASVSPDCAGYIGGGSIVRYKPNDKIATQEAPDSNTFVPAKEYAKIYKDTGYANGYYYVFFHAQDICPGKANAETVQSQVNDALKGLVPKIEVAPGY